ncbi:MAG: flagellar protein FlgN [Nitrospirota bacterium]
MEPRAATDGHESQGRSLDLELETLTVVLEGQIALHQQLLPVLQAEKRLMVEGEVDEVVPCLNEKERLLHRLREAEGRRRDAVAAWAASAGRASREWTLSELIACAPPAYASRLQSCQARLESLTAGIIELNQLNGLVADRLLTRVNGLIGLLRRLTSAGAIYQPSGALHETTVSGRSLGRG